MDGVLIVDKPRGPTSFDVVKEVRRALSVKKAGHTGTLDPMATGVLPVCVGEATKIAQFIIEATKSYDAVIRLGVNTDTLDAEGQVVSERPVPELSRELLEQVFAKFRGSFSQTPPMYSAVRLGGRRLYELAREGREVERAPRPVTVSELTLRDFSACELTLSVTASRGFFVRTLAADLGEALGCGGHLTALRRTACGRFTLTQAVPLGDVLRPGAASSMPRRLVSVLDALSELPPVVVSEADALRVRHGGVVEVSQGAGLVRVMSRTGELLALADVARGRLRYRRVLTATGEA